MGIIISELVIENVKGRAIPKPENDQNTDDILPARFLKEITFKNMGKYVYFDERFKDEEIIDAHPFNNSIYQGGNLLIGGKNYGTGSSRQHAVEGLKRYGIDLIIAESFAEIFAGNCEILGVPTVTVSAEKISELINYVENNPSTEFEVDLKEKVIRYDEKIVYFNMPKERRQAFLTGTWDSLILLQQNEEDIKRVEEELPYLHFK